MRISIWWTLDQFQTDSEHRLKKPPPEPQSLPALVYVEVEHTQWLQLPLQSLWVLSSAERNHVNKIELYISIEICIVARK